LDLETSNLNPSFGLLLCWGIKTFDSEETFQGRITEKDLQGETAADLDIRLVEECANVLGRYETVITYNGTTFDIPWLRTKALRSKIPFPIYGSIWHIDLFKVCKSRLRLGKRWPSLDLVCAYFGINWKTRTDWDDWLLAMVRADEKSVNSIVEHNYGDLMATEEVYKRMSPYFKLTRTSI